MENFNELLQKYADFIVRVGVNPQPGQTLIINCPLEGAPLARLCVRSAYEAGARDVQVNWQDDAVTRIRMELGSEDALTDHKGWQLRRYLDYAESEGGVCVLHLIADDPELFAGLDGAKISRVNSANRSFMQPWREYTMNDRVQWSIAALPAEPWAKKMFPELDTAAAIEAQWKLIFDTCRVTGGDPVGEWQKHLDRLNELGAKMNALDLESVHFESANGTDLTVGLAEQAVWESAGSKNEKGVPFLPNIPTEEVFTAPHKDKVNGVVYGTKPYVFNGQLIKGFHVTFKDGKVVESTVPRKVPTCWASCWTPTRVPATSARWHWCPLPAPSTAAASCSTTPCLTRTPPATSPLATATPAPPWVAPAFPRRSWQPAA